MIDPVQPFPRANPNPGPGPAGEPAPVTAEQAGIEAQHKTRRSAIDLKYSERIQSAESAFKDAADTWGDIEAKVKRQPRYARAIFYWPLMMALTLFEVPVNRLSFELFFRESPVVALGVAFMVGIILIALAHRLGLMLCRFGHHTQPGEDGERSYVSIVWQTLQVVIVTGIILALIYGISVLRQGYLDFVTQPQTGFADVLANGGVSQAATLAFESGLATAGWIFFAINLGIIAVGVTASYFSHDPHPDYQRADLEKKRTERNLRTLQRARADALATEERRYANQMRRASA